MTLKRRVQRALRKSCKVLTVFSPARNSAVRYAAQNNKMPDLKNPQTFSEKLVYLKLNQYAKDPRVIRCADKVAVRGYVTEHGFGHLLNDVIGVFDSAEQIPWAELPDQFALKWNFGATYNIICADKSKLDIKAAKKQINRWGRTRCGLQDGEMHYKNCPKKLICEKYLDTDQGFLPYDYKLYCFHGEVKAILLVMDRDQNKKGGFFSPEWEYIGPANAEYLGFETLPAQPASLSEMLDCARELSKEFPFVRVDFFQYGDRAIFGEMTFTPAAGIFMSQIDVDGVSMGEMLHLDIPGKQEKRKD